MCYIYILMGGFIPRLKSRVFSARLIKKNLCSSGKERDEEDGRLSEYAESIFCFIMDLCRKWNIREIATGVRMIRNPYDVSDKVCLSDPILALEIDVINRLKLRCRRYGIQCHIVDEKGTTRVNALTGDSGGTSSKSVLSTDRKGKMSVHKDINAAMNIGGKIFGAEYLERVSKLVRSKDAVVTTIPYPFRDNAQATECREDIYRKEKEDPKTA